MSKMRVANRIFCIDDVYFDDGVLTALVYDDATTPDVDSTPVKIMHRRDLLAYCKKNGWDISDYENYITADWVDEFREYFFDAIQRRFPDEQRQATNHFIIVAVLFVLIHISTGLAFYYLSWWIGPTIYLVSMLLLNHIARKLNII